MIGMPKRLKTYKVYKIRVFNGFDQVAGKFEVAARNRRDAEDAGIWWAIDNGITPYRVSVMVKSKDGEIATIQVA